MNTPRLQETGFQFTPGPPIPYVRAEQIDFVNQIGGKQRFNVVGAPSNLSNNSAGQGNHTLPPFLSSGPVLNSYAVPGGNGGSTSINICDGRGSGSGSCSMNTSLRLGGMSHNTSDEEHHKRGDIYMLLIVWVQIMRIANVWRHDLFPFLNL